MVGIDAHKKSCTAMKYDEEKERKVLETTVIPTTKQALAEYRDKLPKGTVIVVESSTTGRAVSTIFSPRCEVHMLAPPEKKRDIKTDKRDCLNIIKEDLLEYSRRCYIPTPYIEELRSMVAKQMEIGEKISRAKNQVHSLIERNMLQCRFDGVSDIFGIEGLERLSTIRSELPKQDNVSLTMYLEELSLYTHQHEQMESEFAKIALSDEDCQLVMSHPGIAPFVAVAIKARTGDASRFPTKKHLCSYAGVVPKSDNSGDHVSEHEHIKHGDDVLKYALTCAVRGAVKAKADTAVKRLYLKQIWRGKPGEEAEVIAARKLTCIVWKILTSKQRYAEEDKYLTARKMKKASYLAKRALTHAAKPEDIPTLIEGLASKTEALQMYQPDMHHVLRRSRKRGTSSSVTVRGSGMEMAKK